MSTQESTYKKKYAFTLAEVLITLGIIGVVAAMTMPTLMAKYQEKETSVKLKKAYTTLGQSLNMAIAEYGTVDEWGLNKTVTGSNENGELTTDNSGVEKFCSIMAKYLNGKLLQPGWSQKELLNMQNVSIEDGTTSYAPSDKNAPTDVQLNDGTIINFSQANDNESCKRNNFKEGDYCLAIYVMFPDKGKDFVQGKNHFGFYIMKDRVIPWGLADDFHNPFNLRCKLNISNRQSGRGCTAWVIYNENMDYLHCSDLSWDGKKKCK